MMALTSQGASMGKKKGAKRPRARHFPFCCFVECRRSRLCDSTCSSAAFDRGCHWGRGLRGGPNASGDRDEPAIAGSMTSYGSRKHEWRGTGFPWHISLKKAGAQRIRFHNPTSPPQGIGRNPREEISIQSPDSTDAGRSTHGVRRFRAVRPTILD